MSEVLWTADEVAAACNGRRLGTAAWAATGTSIDSRTLVPGDLFIPLKGPNFDGHAFVAQALQMGAAGAVIADIPAGMENDPRLILVADTMAALEDLGRMGRLRARARIIAVTGSVGKTGTKEALKAALDSQGKSFATIGSLNNHWGVPLSLSRLPADSRFGVFELGMNHAGEIGPLSRMVRPDVAIITNVEAVHIEFFASVEAIADAKAEIFEGMGPTGTAILPRDNPHYSRLLAAARTQGLRVLSFGADHAADGRLSALDARPDSSIVIARIDGVDVTYLMPLPGRHHAINSLAVLLAVKAAGGDVVTAAAALAGLAPIKGRGQRAAIALPGGGTVTLIDESYNASPVSVKAAAGVLGQVPPGPGGRRIAVLGDMRELGEHAPALHAGLAPSLVAGRCDLLFCCGPQMRHLFDAVPAAMRSAHAADSAALAPQLVAALRDGDVVMVKGSAGSRMALVVDALKSIGSKNDKINPQGTAATMNGGEPRDHDAV